MTYLRAHTCKTPVTEPVWVADVEWRIKSGQFESHWQCDECGKIWQRSKFAATREVISTVELRGILGAVSRVLRHTNKHKVVHRAQCWKFAGWTALGEETLVLVQVEGRESGLV